MGVPGRMSLEVGVLSAFVSRKLAVAPAGWWQVPTRMDSGRLPGTLALVASCGEVGGAADDAFESPLAVFMAA